MKVRMMAGFALVCVAVLAGCGKSESSSGGDAGNSHERGDSGRGRERMVRELYAVVQSGDREEEKKFAEDNFAPGFGEKLRFQKYDGAKEVKKAFGKISKCKEVVETQIMKTKAEPGGGEVSVIEAKCDDTTLYFVVGCEKGDADKIMFITTDRNEAMNGRGLEGPTLRKADDAPKGQKAVELKRGGSESTPSESPKRLTPDQKVDRLMAQLRKVLGNSMEVSAALVALQAKIDQLPGDYKVKCVLQEMMGNSYRRSGIVPDLPDPNGNGALAEYLKVRGIDDAGNIMCMYHMLKDKEQAAVAEEVRKLLK